MSANYNYETVFKIKNKLEKKSLTEKLSRNEKILLESVYEALNEAPIDYEGPERMEPGIERKITSKETPYKEHPSLPVGDRDFIELISSKRFKDSVDKVRRVMGNTTAIQGPNPIMGLMTTVMQSLQQIVSIQMNNKEELEKLAVDLVVKELGVPEGSLQFDAQLVMQPMSSAEGMKPQPKMPSEEEIEEFIGDVETFNLERAKRRFINSLIQGAAFKGGHMFNLVSSELDEINPRLMNLYTVSQSLMEHAYWLFPDMEGMAGSGEGQMGQEEVDTETDPPTVRAKALTFPLLVHELVKGVYEVFGTHGLPDDPKAAELVMGVEDTLPSEIWDSRLGPVFWEKFQEAYPLELFEDDMKHIQHHLFFRFSKLDAKQFFKVSNAILAGNPEGMSFIQRLVDEIVSDLKKQEYEDTMKQYGSDDDDDIDDIDISSLGF